MGRRLAVQCLALVMTGALCCGVPQVCRAQAAPGPDVKELRAVVAKAPTLTYPAAARMAHVTGDVALVVRVRNDGSVESVILRSGPPLLQQAAVDNARASQFDCQGCEQPLTEYSLLYTFQLSETAICPDEAPPGGKATYPQVTRSPGHVTIVDENTIICDPSAEITKVRSIKCLFLWKCAYHRF